MISPDRFWHRFERRAGPTGGAPIGADVRGWANIGESANRVPPATGSRVKLARAVGGAERSTASALAEPCGAFGGCRGVLVQKNSVARWLRHEDEVTLRLVIDRLDLGQNVGKLRGVQIR